jgi:hypothetical protein
MLGALWQLQAVEVGERHTQVLCLSTLVWTHRNISVCTAGKAWVHSRAESRLSGLTVPATSIGDVKGQDDSVAFLEEHDAWADLGDDAHVLVAGQKIKSAGLISTNFCSHQGVSYPNTKPLPPSAAVLPSYIYCYVSI